jgi:hypothetical protein
MTTALKADLTAEQVERLTAAINSTLTGDLAAEVVPDAVMRRNGDLLVPVRPHAYPERMYSFLEGLAMAEINLRDAGMAVRLQPDVRQRELVVAWEEIGGNRRFRWPAFLSVDGDESTDLPAIADCEETPGRALMYQALPYDDAEDLLDALKRARERYPEVDFSRIGVPEATTPAAA